MVATVIAIMAAVAVPMVITYLRNYKIRSAVRDVVGGLQAARSRAIMSNTNNGVSFVIIDADSYRYVQEDLTGAGETPLSPVRDLPAGVEFMPVAGSPSVRFRRLGDYCFPGVSPCAAGVTQAVACPGPDASRCTKGAGASYIAAEGSPPAPGGVAGGHRIRIEEIQTNLVGWVLLAPGGRVSADYRQTR